MTVSYRRGLKLKEALELARMAADDFPGLTILLHPRFRPAPLSDHLELDGFALIVAGPHGDQPWFEILRATDYAYLHAAVYQQYAPEEEDEDEGADTGADTGGDERREGGGPGLLRPVLSSLTLLLILILVARRPSP